MEITPEIDRHLTANMNLSKKDIVIGNFLGGLAWGLGTVVGATVVAAIIGIILNSLGVFATIGEFFGQSQQIPNLPR